MTSSEGMGVVPQPNYEQCNPSDSACVARNQVLNTQYNVANIQDLWSRNNSGPMPVGWMTAGDTPTIQQAVAQSYNTTAAPNTGGSKVTSGGKVQFNSPRGSNSLQVGDTWLVTIMGATPNSPVSVNAGGATTPMGVTNNSGNFLLSGIARTVDIGSWSELWSVGGLSSGAFQFTVSAATDPIPVVPQSQATSGTTSSTPAVTNPPVVPTSQNVFDLFGETSQITIPGTSIEVGTYTAIAIAAALVVGYMMTKGRR